MDKWLFKTFTEFGELKGNILNVTYMVKPRSYFKYVSSSEQPVHYGTQLLRSRDLSSLCYAAECGNLGF